MSTKITLLVAAAIATGLLAAGCGGDDNDSGTTTSSLTKPEFVAKANAICKNGNDQINQEGNATFSKGKPTQADEEKFATDTIIPNVQKQIDDIEALGAPAGDEAQVKAITDSAQKDLDAAKSDPTLFTDASKGDPFAATNKLANAYGLTVCGSG